jgi:AcrR family transcriptional regulator
MDVRPAVPLRQTRRFEKKREAILGAAATLFNQRGVKGATLADVAQAVALITNSVTYYYRKKEDLASACFLRTIDALNAIIEQAAQAHDSSARVRELFRLYAILLARIAAGEHPDLVHFHDIRALYGSHAEMVFAAYTDMFRSARRLLHPRDGDGGDRAKVNARAHVLVSTINAMGLWISRYETQDYRLVADRVANILIAGINGRGARWAPRTLPEFSNSDDFEAPAEAFLRAATDLINEQGYRGASVEKISARLNVSKGSFYHYNDNKDDLVANCFMRSFEVIRRAQNAAAALDGDGWTKLTAAAAELVRYQLSALGPLLRSSALSALPESMRPELVQTMRRLGERYSHFIVEGAADGSVRPVDQAIASQLVSDMVNAAAELRRWAPLANDLTAPELFARPLFLGLFSD